MTKGRTVAGIGGWTFEPWRETFYPADLPKARELEHASRHVTSIEINGTFYRTQTPATFRKWAEATPAGFVFSVKAHRVTTNRKDLSDAKQAIGNFLGSGLLELGTGWGRSCGSSPRRRNSTRRRSRHSCPACRLNSTA